MKYFKGKLINILIIMLMITLVFSNTITDNSTLATEEKSDELIITKHKITREELEDLKIIKGVYDENTNYKTTYGNYSAGLVPPTEEQWDYIAETTYIIDKISIGNSTLPSNYDISEQKYFPPIGDQINSSCVSWSTGYYMATYQTARINDWNLSGVVWDQVGGYPFNHQDKIFSPYFIYNHINKGDGDSGSNFANNHQLLYEIGICTWDKNFVSDSNYNVSAWPNESAYREAPLYHAKNESNDLILNSNESIEDLKILLCNNITTSFGLKTVVLTQADENGVITNQSFNNSSGGGHQITFVGYDDDKSYEEDNESRSGAFKVANSWGPDDPFSDPTAPGFYWFSYTAVLYHIDDCEWFDINDTYEPDLIAVFEMNHSKRGECTIKINMDNTTNPSKEKLFKFDGGEFNFPNNLIVMDISEFNDSISTPHAHDFFLEVIDDNISNATGSIQNFSIEYYSEYNILGPDSENCYGYDFNTDSINTSDGGIVYSSVLLSIYNNDTGIKSINYPIGGSHKTGNISVNATIRNYGNYDQENIIVNCSIYQYTSKSESWDRIWSENKTINSVSYKGEIDFNFSNWNAVLGNYSINVSTHLLNDDFPLDDYMNLTVYIENRNDSGVVSINNPKGKILKGYYRVNSTVKNYGTWNLTNVTVNCSVYRDEGTQQNLTFNNLTIIENLNPYEERTYLSPLWNFSMCGWYTINVSTSLDSILDDNISNDCKLRCVRVPSIVVYVDDDFNSSTPGWNAYNFSSIQDGIDAVESYGIVNVFNGTYNENVIVNLTINLSGENKQGTIIDGGGNGTVVTVLEDFVNISGFTIKGSKNTTVYENVGINIPGSSYINYITISNNIILNNSKGILIINPGGLQSSPESTYIDILTNIINNNTNGIKMETVRDNLIEDNKFINNDDNGIHFDNSRSNIIMKNTFMGNNNGTYLTSSSNNNIFHHNNFYDNTSYHSYDECNNSWDYNSIGNFWDDYKGSDTNNDSIGEAPYNISGGDNQDHYPLINPWRWINITILEDGWNFMSIPFNKSIDKTITNISYNNTNYNWSDAVTAEIINEYVFGWNRSSQSYIFADNFDPGYGYWLYAHEVCELYIETFNVSTDSDSYISDVNASWNIVGIPSTYSVEKVNLTVIYNGSEYNWDEAVSNGTVNNFIFGWSRTWQSYTFNDSLEPGHCYWIYSYEDCTLLYNANVTDGGDSGGGDQDGGDGWLWEAQLMITTNYSDASTCKIYLGENENANDGPPADDYDAPGYPNPPGSYVEGWFDNGLSGEYAEMSRDIRWDKGEDKIWNLSVYWDPVGTNSTTVNISWNQEELAESRYEDIIMFEDEEVVADMLQVSYYTYVADANNESAFTIECYS